MKGITGIEHTSFQAFNEDRGKSSWKMEKWGTIFDFPGWSRGWVVMTFWRSYGGLEVAQVPSDLELLLRSLVGCILRCMIGEGVEKDMGLTLREYKLCTGQSSGTCPTISPGWKGGIILPFNS